jgi:hypothetical protein
LKAPQTADEARALLDQLVAMAEASRDLRLARERWDAELQASVNALKAMIEGEQLPPADLIAVAETIHRTANYVTYLQRQPAAAARFRPRLYSN